MNAPTHVISLHPAVAQRRQPAEKDNTPDGSRSDSRAGRPSPPGTIGQPHPRRPPSPPPTGGGGISPPPARVHSSSPSTTATPSTPSMPPVVTVVVDAAVAVPAAAAAPGGPPTASGSMRASGSGAATRPSHTHPTARWASQRGDRSTHPPSGWGSLVASKSGGQSRRRACRRRPDRRRHGATRPWRWGPTTATRPPPRSHVSTSRRPSQLYGAVGGRVPHSGELHAIQGVEPGGGGPKRGQPVGSPGERVRQRRERQPAPQLARGGSAPPAPVAPSTPPR